MPTYQYRCQACANELEAFQKFTDAPLVDCPECGGSLRKVFSPVGIVFKGSGFYATDSRSASSTALPGKASDEGESAPDKSAAKTKAPESKS